MWYGTLAGTNPVRIHNPPVIWVGGLPRLRRVQRDGLIGGYIKSHLRGHSTALGLFELFNEAKQTTIHNNLIADTERGKFERLIRQ